MKITIKFPHTHAGETYPAGTILELDDKTARWLCDQKIDNQPCAVPYTGDDSAANQAAAKTSAA